MSESGRPDKPIPVRLDWRTENCLSDWTIEVRTPGKASRLYHVHRCMLAVQSEYFAGLLAEGEGRTSMIDLKQDAAENFPLLLDYIYRQELDVCTENATALHHLAQYFGIKPMVWEVQQFLMNDIQFENCARYYEQAVIFHDRMVQDAVRNLCRTRVNDIERDMDIVQVSDLSLWLHILHSSTVTEHPEESRQAASEHLSNLIAEYCFQNRSEMSPAIFGQLTTSQYLPHLSAQSSMEFLELGREITGAREGKLSSLEVRCIEALKKHWASIDTASLRNKLASYSPLFLSEFLCATLEEASEQSKSMAGDIEEVVALADSLYARVKDLTDQLNKKDEELEHAKKELRVAKSGVDRNVFGYSMPKKEVGTLS